MSRFVEIQCIIGSAKPKRVINLDMVSELNEEKKMLYVVCGGVVKTYCISDDSVAVVKQAMTASNSSSADAMLQMQRDLDAYKNCFINAIGYAKDKFGEGKVIPAIGLFPDVSGEVNDQISEVWESLRTLNEKYHDALEQLKKNGIDFVDSHALDPDKQ